MNITINGEPRQLQQALSVQQLITELDLADKRLAVELNEQIVPRGQFEHTALQDGDVIEIVHAIGGG